MEVGAMGSMYGNRPGIRHCRWKKVGLVRRHVLGALAGVLSLALVLAACGNEQGGGGTSGGTAAHKIKMVAASYSDKTQGYGLPLGSEEAQAEFSLFMWGNGGDWKQGDKWTINSPQNVAALQFMKKLASEGLTEPNPGKTNRTDGVWRLFAQGKVATAAIMPLGTFANSTMQGANFKWASTPFPVNQGNPEFTLGVMDSLMAFKKPGNQEAVKKFLSFVYQKDNYLKFNQIEGFLPVTASASEAMKSDPIAGPGIALLPKARFYPLTDPNWGKVRGAVLNQLGTALEPNGDPKKVLDAIQQVAEQGG